MSMRNNDIDKLVEQALQSFDGAKRAEPRPFLLTRVMAAVNDRSVLKSTWAKAAGFISRPGVAIAGIACIIVINCSILFLHKNAADKNAVVQNSALATDDFAANAANIYEIENPEAP